MIRPCIWCGEPLDTFYAASDGEEAPSIVACSCGVEYSRGLLEVADDEVWNAICRRDGYVVERKSDNVYYLSDHKSKDENKDD